MNTRRISGWLAGSILLATGLAQADSAIVFPQPIPSPDYGDFTVTASPGSVAIGKPVTATWTAAPPGGSDWVGLFEAGAANEYHAYCYTGGLANGSCQLFPPTPGTWELRYFLGNPSYTLVAVSARFEVFDPCAGVVRSLSVVGPVAGGPGRRLDVRWNVSIPECISGSDWVGVYAVGAPNTTYLGYFYTGAASGTQTVYATLPPGTYEFRYMPAGGYVDAARSFPFSVMACAAGDADCDSRPDATDLCPYWAESNPSADRDGDGRGDECECSDQNGDGRNTVADLVAINQALFNPALVTPLCDGNGDGRCDVKDILAASLEIYSPGHTATCARNPFLP